MIRYLLTFPIATKIIKSKNLTLNKPATKVNGSPKIGTQANSKDHLPNFSNRILFLLDHSAFRTNGFKNNPGLLH